MKWRYKNETDKTVYWRGVIWAPGDELESNSPVPIEYALTCTQEGDVPEQTLLHEDRIIAAGATYEVTMPRPKLGQWVRLTIFNLSSDGAIYRFNNKNNNPLPLDVRGFDETILWEACAKIYIENISNVATHISVSAVEVRH